MIFFSKEKRGITLIITYLTIFLLSTRCTQGLDNNMKKPKKKKKCNICCLFNLCCKDNKVNDTTYEENTKKLPDILQNKNIEIGNRPSNTNSSLKLTPNSTVSAITPNSANSNSISLRNNQNKKNSVISDKNDNQISSNIIDKKDNKPLTPTPKPPLSSINHNLQPSNTLMVPNVNREISQSSLYDNYDNEYEKSKSRVETMEFGNNIAYLYPHNPENHELNNYQPNDDNIITPVTPYKEDEFNFDNINFKNQTHHRVNTNSQEKEYNITDKSFNNDNQNTKKIDIIENTDNE